MMLYANFVYEEETMTCINQHKNVKIGKEIITFIIIKEKKRKEKKNLMKMSTAVVGDDGPLQ